MIPEQIRLPPRVAWGVVIQGIRIRLGRSIVTILGVACGIAFLMSIFTGEIVKSGVANEESLRAETRRMFSFLIAEMGPPADRTIGVIQVGDLSETEKRLLTTLAGEKIKSIRWARISGIESWSGKSSLPISQTKPAEAAVDASALLIMGGSRLPNLDWTKILQPARQRILALTDVSESNLVLDDSRIVSLKKPIRPEEAATMAREAEKDKVRTIWITTISLLVTVICIANAMLMSVTERFQEIGTMKCLGATSKFIRSLFLFESCLMGLVGGVFGGVAGGLFSVLLYSTTYGAGLVLPSLLNPVLLLMLVASIIIGVVLSIIAAIYPASVASAMRPAVALRTNI